MPELTSGEFELVYNMLSLAIAAMLGSFIFFVTSRGQLSEKYRPAMILSSLVVAIAGYHYWRIFNSWGDAYVMNAAGGYVASGKPFNDAYRYVDWLLTVPLLVAELVAVLALSKKVRTPLMAKLVVASAAMIILGYPGELAAGTTRVVWAVLSTIPFIYILYVLWVELSRAAQDNGPDVKKQMTNIRLLLLATWGFYPIAYAMPLLGVEGSTAQVALQVGYSIADVAAKCGYGFMIYALAKAKMEQEAARVVSPLSSSGLAAAA